MSCKHTRVWIQDVQKVNCSNKKVLGEHSIQYIVIDDRLTYNFNKVYMYMILVGSICAFLVTMGLLI